MRAAVVGAGLAGLAAADAIRRAGHDVAVFEARDRIGGRVWSQPFAGAVTERGGEFVLPGAERLGAACERLGLELHPKGTRYGDREPRGGIGVDAAALAAAVADLRGGGAAAGGTLAAALADRVRHAGAREAIAARLAISSAYPESDLAATVLDEAGAGFGAFETRSVRGGNARLAEALAAGLEVVLAAPVEAVEWEPAGPVRIAGAGFEHVADAAVIAVPAAQAASLRYEPALPAPKRAALAGVRYGVAAKLAVRLARPAPPSATLDVAARFWCYTQLGPDGAPSPVVTCFAGTAAAVAALGVDDGPERWLAALRRLRPDLGLTGDALLTTWAPGLLEPGAYSARSHASPLRHADLAAPVGPLQFAGEHTAGPAHALMEGAIASGERAAAALLDAVAGRSR